MKLFDDIGEKIMLIAKISVFSVPVLTLIAVIREIRHGGHPLVCLAVGLLLFASAWPLYGFGQLVRDIHDMRMGDGRIDPRGDELPRL